jgi:hypothetical protein
MEIRKSNLGRHPVCFREARDEEPSGGLSQNWPFFFEGLLTS